MLSPKSESAQKSFLVTTVEVVEVPAEGKQKQSFSESALEAFDQQQKRLDNYEYEVRIDILTQADKLGITDAAMRFLSGEELTLPALGAYRLALWQVVLFSPVSSTSKAA